MNGLIVDLFAGGGGASLGIEWALGRSPDIAVNHDAAAVAMHTANHPRTRHLCGDVFHYSPREVTGGKPVALLWASPDCTHFSRAKGGKPKSKKVRGLAWVVARWAREVKPRVIVLENVSEFQGWGPLDDAGQPIREKVGFTFRRWLADLRRSGYVVEWRELRACDYGAPTTRKRLFLVARCDGLPIAWPSPTHGNSAGLFQLKPYRAAAECIDWALPARSIFEREKPLADKTLARIARGLERFVLAPVRPFIAPIGGKLAAASMVQTGYGERKGQDPRALDIGEPLGTVVAGGAKHALVAAFLAKHYGGNEATGSSLTRSMDTITCQDHHALVTAHEQGERRAEVLAFLSRHGIVSNLVRAGAETFEIRDIGMRMLTPRELFRAQGFPDSYVIDPLVDGEPISKSLQIEKCGNSVPPHLSCAMVAANVGARAAVAA
jgi:DNA (cytosine-5)-methyltransferase 1